MGNVNTTNECKTIITIRHDGPYGRTTTTKLCNDAAMGRLCACIRQVEIRRQPSEGPGGGCILEPSWPGGGCIREGVSQ